VVALPLFMGLSGEYLLRPTVLFLGKLVIGQLRVYGWDTFFIWNAEPQKRGDFIHW